MAEHNGNLTKLGGSRSGEKAMLFIFLVGYCVGRDSLQQICSTVRTENIQYTLIRGKLLTTLSRFTDINIRLVSWPNDYKAP